MRPPWVRGARAAFVFLTRVPVGGFPYTREDWSWAGAYFPLVGAAIGVACGAVQWALGSAGSLAASLVALGVSMMLTGAFHEDGLADTADALGGAYTREKLFVILKDSRIGSFGAAALFCVLALRVALFARFDGSPIWAWVLAGTLARTAPVWMMAKIPYVTGDEESKSRQLTRIGVAQAWVATAIAAVVLVLAMATGVSATSVIAMVLAVAVTAGICAWRFVVRAGGITGDFLGATEQVGECAVLLALAMTT